jgi:hypothetical protein
MKKLPHCTGPRRRDLRFTTTGKFQMNGKCQIHTVRWSIFSSKNHHCLIEQRLLGFVNNIGNINLLILPFFLGICFFMGSCATDRATMDLVKYVNQDILDIAQLEQKALESYASVTGKNYTTNARVYKALKDDVIPHYRQFVDLLRDINPKTQEVRELHGIYIRGTEYLYKGFREKMFGLEIRDVYLVRAANTQIEKGRVETDRWRKELADLCRHYGVAEKVEKKKWWGFGK